MAENKAAQISRKHVLIDKANQIALVALSVAVATVIFCLFVSQAIIKQNSYNQKVINEKKIALKQIKENRENVKNLVSSYQSFATEPVNVIGGNPIGPGPKDGDNPRIILDALPSQYDFPGFASSIEKLIQTQGGLTIDTLGGNDEGNSSPTPPATAAATPAPTNNTIAPTPILMPIGVKANYTKTQEFVKALESSIRPIYISSFKLGGTDADIQLNLSLTTYYQPEKKFDVGSKVVK